LDQKSNELGVQFNLLEKVFHLATLLKAITINSFLSNNLTLKGGTAINLFWGEIPRLSIDIDFDFTGEVQKENMLRIKEPLLDALKIIGKDLGYNIRETPPSYIMSRIYFKYRPIRLPADSIKIEINFLNRIPLLPRITKPFYNIFPDKIHDFSIFTYQLEELLAMKTEAFLERKLPRDLFDIYNLINIGQKKINVVILKKAILLYFCMSRNIINLIQEIGDFKDFFDFFIKIVNNIEEKTYKTQVEPYISRRKLYTWKQIKNHLINFFGNCLQLDTNELKFWKSFFIEHKFPLHLITNNISEFNENLEKHPSILRVLGSGSESE